MRKSRVIGFAIAGILSVGTLAQAQSTTTPHRHATGRTVRGARGHTRLLRGIELTDAEKTQVKAIHTKYRAEARSLRESLRPALQDVRAARQKRDSVAVKAAWEKSAGDRQKLQALMQRERADIRTALSVEHQAQFDANVKQLEQRRAGRTKDRKGHRARKANGAGVSKS